MPYIMPPQMENKRGHLFAHVHPLAALRRARRGFQRRDAEAVARPLAASELLVLHLVEPQAVAARFIAGPADAREERMNER